MTNNKNIIKKQNYQELIKHSRSLLDITKNILKNSKREVVVVKKPPEIVNADDNNFILIKAGSFMMGSDERADEQPIHKVTIEYDFYMSKYQVTFEEYDLFCEATGKEKPDDEGWGRDKRPVINVYWEDATEYCEWRSRKEGKTYRLPTESEWEYACRAGTTTKWSFGDDELELAQYAWFKKNSYDKGSEHKDYGTHSVGTKKPNPWGFYDMHGNVYEWCEDWEFENYNKTPTDGSAHEYGDKASYKILRGGSWDGSSHYTRSSDRGMEADDRIHDFGFRLVLQRIYL